MYRRIRLAMIPKVKGKRTRLSITCILVLANLLLISFTPLAQTAGGPDTDQPSSRQVVEPGPDLTVTNITLSTENPVDGAIINFFATVENIGQETAEDFLITLHAGGQQLSSVQVTSLGPNNSTTASAEVHVQAGFLEIKAVADPTGQVAEVTEANNFLVRTMSIRSPDLYFSDVSFFPANYSDGDPVLVTSTVVNGGSDTTTPFTCLLMVDDQVLRSKIFYGLGAGDSLVVSGEWTASSGPHDILAKADTDGSVREANESNNIMLRSLGTTYPDLTVESMSSTPALTNLSDGDHVIIEATIRNLGSDTHGTFSIRFLVDGVELASGPMSGLLANDTVDVSFEWFATGGKHEMRLDVDASGRIVEANEGNNFRLMGADIPLPDLWIRDMVTTPFFPIDGSDMTVSTEVRNEGPGATHRPFYMQFLANGDLMGQVDIPNGLEANTTTLVNFTFTATAGRTDLSAMIDPASAMPEVDEGNNGAFRTIFVPLPDLTLTSLNVTKGLRDGDSGNIQVTVINNGPGNTTSTFFVDFAMDGETLSRVAVEGLPIGMSKVLSVPFSASGGERHISVRTDGGRTLNEADETNNLLQLPVVIGMPDLVVEDIAWLPASPVVDEVVTLTAMVTNHGRPTQRQVFIEFLMDGVVLASTSVSGPSLAGGTAVSAPWKVTGNEAFVEVRMDTSMFVPELDETNNHMARSFPNGTLVPNPPGPDLVLIDLSWLPHSPSDGEEVSFIVSIENQGAIPDPGPDGTGALTPGVVLFVDNEKIASSSVKILSTEAVAVVPWTASIGDHTVRAVVDWAMTELETNETNNAMASNMSVGRPDLTLSGLDFVSGSPDDGNSVAMFVQVDNLGNRTIRSFSLQFFVDGVYIGREDVEGVLLNKSTTVTHNWKATPGIHTVTVVADLLGAVIELDETNNAFSNNITVKRPNLALVSLEAASVVDDGSQSLVTVKVQNRGQGGTVRTFLVSFYLDGQEMGSQFVNGLPSGNEVVVSRGISPGPGRHYLRVVVDTAGAIVETDERDNTFSRPGLNVTSSDLAVTGLDLVSQDDRSTIIFATVRNSGNTTTRPFTVAFYEDGDLLSTTKVDGLAGGFSTTVSMTWPHQFGSHRVRAVVDPWGNIAETDEANNQKVLQTPFLEYPDLYIDETDILGPMVPGAEVTFVARIRNIGGDTRTPFSVRFLVDGEQLGEAKVGGLPGGSSVYVSFDTYGIVGQHHLRIVVDDTGLVPEANEMNNAQSTTYTISAPDLRVSEISVFGHSKGVAIFAKVRNDGTHLLRPVVVSFYADGELVGEVLVRGLPAFTTTEVMQLIPTDTETVTVVADGKGEVPEKVDNNNDRTLRVRPNPVEGELDLEVTDIFWVPQFPVDGQKVTFFAIIENIGERTMTDDVVVDFLMDSGSKAQGHLSGLSDGSTSVIAASWDIDSGSNINLTVVLDGDQVLNETRHDNNAFTTWMNVSAADLAISSVVYSDGLFGEDNVAFVKVANDGDGDLIDRFTTNIYVEGEMVASESYNGMPSDTNSTLTFDMHRSWGRKELLVEVDPKAEVQESDENNVWLGQVDLGYPDLQVLDVWCETGINASTTTAFTEIRNTGVGIGTDFQVRMTVNGVDLGPKVLRGLDKNMTAVVPWTFSTEQIVRIEASVDDNNVIPESNELNNYFERNAMGNITYVPPDVNMGLISLNITQYGTPTNHYKLTATVENQGINVSSFYIKFLVDGRTLTKVPVQVMRGNTTRQVTQLWEGLSERHVFKVIVDCDRDIAEYDESDNEKRKVVPANHPPIAYPGNDQSITEGDRATLWARGYDIDGRIVKYEWDFNGDGNYDWSSNSSQKVMHRYGKTPPKGQRYFNATLRVTDDRGAVSTATVKIKVSERRPWTDILPDDLSFLGPFTAGMAFIAAAIVLLYLFMRQARPFKESHEERERRRKKEMDGERRIWPPWKREIPKEPDEEND